MIASLLRPTDIYTDDVDQRGPAILIDDRPKQSCSGAMQVLVTASEGKHRMVT